jgi:hypothetical protein
MEVKIGEQPNINVSLSQSPPINIAFETKFLRGGDFVASAKIKYIEPLTESQYNNLVKNGEAREDTFYIIYDE